MCELFVRHRSQLYEENRQLVMRILPTLLRAIFYFVLAFLMCYTRTTYEQLAMLPFGHLECHEFDENGHRCLISFIIYVFLLSWVIYFICNVVLQDLYQFWMRTKRELLCASHKRNLNMFNLKILLPKKTLPTKQPQVVLLSIKKYLN